MFWSLRIPSEVAGWWFFWSSIVSTAVCCMNYEYPKMWARSSMEQSYCVLCTVYGVGCTVKLLLYNLPVCTYCTKKEKIPDPRSQIQDPNPRNSDESDESQFFSRLFVRTKIKCNGCVCCVKLFWKQTSRPSKLLSPFRIRMVISCPLRKHMFFLNKSSSRIIILYLNSRSGRNGYEETHGELV